MNWGRGQRPVINVSWHDAQAYCEWLSRATSQAYRFPTEAEWEYACRAGTTTRYSFGNGITPKDANYWESKLGKTTEGCSYPPNPWGLYDMHGNVREWLEDVWHESYEGAPADERSVDRRRRKVLSRPRCAWRLLVQLSVVLPLGRPQPVPSRRPELQLRLPGCPNA